MMSNSARLFVFVISALVLFSHQVDVSVRASCPCSEEKLCERITKEAEKEVLVWSTSAAVWRHYNWSVVTTIAVFRDWDNELMCFAHSKVVILSISLYTLFNWATLYTFVSIILYCLRYTHKWNVKTQLISWRPYIYGSGCQAKYTKFLINLAFTLNLNFEVC